MKNVFVVLLSFFIGLSFSKFFTKSEKDSQGKEVLNITNNIKTGDIAKKIESIAEVDLKEYNLLKKSKEKYEKADEILGKVMVIFLANVGLEARKNIRQLEDEIKDKKEKPTDNETNQAKEIIDTNGFIQEETGESRDSIGSVVEVKNEESKRGKKYFEKIAERMRYKDTSIFFTSKPFKKNSSLFKKINGRFTGIIKNRKKDDETLDEDFLLDINYQEIEGKLKGTYALNISRLGVTYSSKSGNGDNGSIKRDPVNRNYIILEAGPGMYMQLRYLNNRKMFVGNYYENGKVYFVTDVKKD